MMMMDREWISRALLSKTHQTVAFCCFGPIWAFHDKLAVDAFYDSDVFRVRTCSWVMLCSHFWIGFFPGFDICGSFFDTFVDDLVNGLQTKTFLDEISKRKNSPTHVFGVLYECFHHFLGLCCVEFS
jgi:hypothetical protein